MECIKVIIRDKTNRARPEGRFYENQVCIVLIIGLEIDVMKKSLTTRESIYIELFFVKKIIVLG